MTIGQILERRSWVVSIVDIIALADIITPDGTVRAEKGQVVDTVRTDFNGNVSSKPLCSGPYNVVEKDAPVEYRIAEPINVALVYGDQERGYRGEADQYIESPEEKYRQPGRDTKDRG